MSVRICFNPRPSLPRGDAVVLFDFFLLQPVSIHAPRCRGAMLVNIGSMQGGFCVSIHAPRCRGAMQSPFLSRRSPDESGFNPRPSLPRGDAPYFRKHRKPANWFQSTPLVAEGRCAKRPGSLPVWRRFNPRPSLPRGDATTLAVTGRARSAFQSTPLVAEGRCAFPASSTVCRLQVSIHAPRCRGAMLISRNYRKHQNKKPALREPLYS